MKEIPGENIGVFGITDTGKTHEVMRMCKELLDYKNKKCIVFDHANNRFYKDIANTISLEELEYLDQLDVDYYKVSGSDDWDRFCSIATKHIHNSSIVLDDCGGSFRGNLSDTLYNFVKSCKNNGNDIFYQGHDIQDIAPKLLTSLHMILLKEQSLPYIPKKVPKYMHLQYLLDEIREINNKDPKGKLWAYRIFEISTNNVFVPDANNEPKFFKGRDYFKFNTHRNKSKK